MIVASITIEFTIAILIFVASIVESSQVTSLTSQMLQQLRDIMREKIQQFNHYIFDRRNQSQQNFTRTMNFVNDHERFKIIDFEFFHSNVSKSWNTKFIIFFHKKTIYREIYVFVSRINDYAHLIDEIIVRDNLSLYLRKIVIIWYLKKIDDFKRKTFKNLSLIDFIDELKKRFKMRIVKILNKLITKIFIVKNVKKKRETIDFLQNIIFYAQFASIIDLQKQFIWVWQQLNVNFRDFVIMSIIYITIQNFIEKLKIKRDLWKQMFVKRFVISNRNFNKSKKRDDDDSFKFRSSSKYRSSSKR